MKKGTNKLPKITDDDAHLLFRRIIQKVATGPEMSKDISLDDSYQAMSYILSGAADPIQVAIYLIALRMKRETLDENTGSLKAIIDASKITVCDAPEVLDIAEAYDGFVRNVPITPFLPSVLAACGQPTVTHGLQKVGPKFGATHHTILHAAGKKVDCDPVEAAQKIADPDCGWGYVDQKEFCQPLHDLVEMRTRLVKRPVITTVEVLCGPIRGKKKTHLITGYVHKAYPPIYAHLARVANFDSAIIVRGVEGGIAPSLKQTNIAYQYYNKEQESEIQFDPVDIGIEQNVRAIPLPELAPAKEQNDKIAAEVDVEALSLHAADVGFSALKGEKGAARDSLIYMGAMALKFVKKYDDMQKAADAVRESLDTGKALAHFETW